jgi:prepilin-type N-terminal cleavage/methylation domain-containing protein
VKNAHFSRSRKGFTLVEMLIATSLIVLLLLFNHQSNEFFTDEVKTR